ncbi:CMGC/DYRK/PRP4 protein kinase [Kwoniella heveanensis BCC8398]|uniref:non-specific serine/threonine protein kinase n=1 Tax=Kwoniella heveanensis BCC8398 TaxID=1296120 RepID=A0A1B9GPD1_9TREE|nr:CMGC/DYRK/PRP4 protein kinase [Kwoniella heveanensis BCC8398]
MSSSGVKRPHQDDSAYSASGRSDRSHEHHEDRRTKPRDWRDAFLDEDEPRRRRSRSRERDRDHRRQRDEHHHQDRDRKYPRGYDDERERDRRRGGGLDYRERDYREREPIKGREDQSRRHGDRSDRRRDDHHDYYKSDDRDRRINKSACGADREEGEPLICAWFVRSARLEPSPPKSVATLPARSPSRAPSSPARDGANTAARGRAPPAGPRGGFQSVSIPTQPRSGTSRSRPPPSDRFSEAEGSGSKQANFEQAKQEEDEPVVVLEEERDPEKVLEERRRKREEIMAKFRANGGKASTVTTPKTVISDLPGHGYGANSVTSAGTRTGVQTEYTTTTAGATPLLKHLGTRSTTGLPGTSAPTPIGQSPTLASTPMGNDFDLAKHADSAGHDAAPPEAKTDGVGAEMMISAADYDPTLDTMADQEKRRKDMEAIKVEPKDVADGVGEPIVVEEHEPEEDEYEEVEIEEEEEEDEFDMFAAFGGEEKEKKKRKVTVRRLKNGVRANGKPEYIKKPASTIAPEVVDNVDDTEGYYRILPGEILDDGRYQVTITLGKGMFSAVVKAKVLKAVNQERRQDVVGKEVAIKVIRSQESMYVAGRKEAQILKKLNEADPEDKKHIVRMEHTFEHKGHLCIVTESLSMNMRDVIKRFGKDVGLNMRAVRAYAHQLFLALSLMRKCSIVHADIKPDNVLVTENKATLKVCDLGSAAEITEGEVTPYLVSRFYRAPEIILGLPYDTAIDTWSVGCTLYELFTGKILFPGRSNNHMLLLMMELKGKLNHRMIKKATFGSMHFDESLNFISIERDKITGQDVAKTMVISKATKDLRARLLPSSSIQLKMKDDELKQILNFVDLLEKCLHLDPSRRISPRDALTHPFLTG